MIAFVRYFVEQAKDNGFATFYWRGLSDGEHRSVPEFNQKDLVEVMAKGYYGEEGYNDVAFTVSDSAEGTVYYDLFGNRHKSPVKGVNIVRMDDGTTKNLLQK